MCISIVIPARNAEATLERAVMSVLALADDAQIIIVDDGSTDETLRIASSMRGFVPNLVIVEVMPGRGVAHARNTGMAAVRNPWVTFLDADDTLCSDDYLRLFIAELPQKEADVIFFLHKSTSLAREPQTYGLVPGRLTKLDILELVKAYLWSPVGHSLVTHCWGKIYNTAFIKRYNIYFDESLRIYEDTKFVACCLRHVTVGLFVSKSLYSYEPGSGLSAAFEYSPWDFVHAVDEFSHLSGGGSHRPRANAAFIAKTLSLSKDLPFKRRVDLYGRMARYQVPQNIDVRSIRSSMLRIIVMARMWRFPIALALTISVARRLGL